MQRFPKFTPPLDEVVHDQRRLLGAIIAGDGAAAERAAAELVTTFEGEIRKVI